ncbi:MAG: A/G-specific adenine glycosylase [Prevotella sp.]|nr:A/G-specific adenine glycosylase [Prevotella sp.]
MDFTATLLDWYARHGRTLPWRETRDPYPIWLSEVILQQTRIQQGMAYWERFMRRFPTVEALAEADEDEVLRLWQGLGYYSRARNLHAAARQIVAMGGFPRTIEGIRSLKGVGDYTAAAIGSFAFGLPAAAIDGNAYRVLARHFGIDTPVNTTEGKKVFAALSAELLPRDRAADYNQAMMDFGATWCTPSSPRCADCPLAESCVALREGRVGQLPVKEKKMKIQTRCLIYIYIRCQGMTAIRRRGAGDIWQGLWEPVVMEAPHQLPRGGGNDYSSPHDTPSVSPSLGGGTGEVLEALTGKALLLRQNVKHVLTHRILLADFYLWETDERPVLPEDYIWIPESEIDRYAVPRLVEKLLEIVDNTPFRV